MRILFCASDIVFTVSSRVGRGLVGRGALSAIGPLRGDGFLIVFFILRRDFRFSLSLVDHFDGFHQIAFLLGDARFLEHHLRHDVGQHPRDEAYVKYAQNERADHENKQRGDRVPELSVLLVDNQELDKVPRAPDDRGEEEA